MIFGNTTRATLRFALLYFQNSVEMWSAMSMSLVIQSVYEGTYVKSPVEFEYI
jgi:hypothetical protein